VSPPLFTQSGLTATGRSAEETLCTRSQSNQGVPKSIKTVKVLLDASPGSCSSLSLFWFDRDYSPAQMHHICAAQLQVRP